MESGDKREVFIDTNFFMIPFQFNVDILEEFKRILPNLYWKSRKKPVLE